MFGRLLGRLWAILEAKGNCVRTDDMILVSVDDHVVEPPDMFAGHLPAQYADAAPKVVTTETGADVWVYDGATIPNIGLNAVAGRPREDYGTDPTSFDEIRPGCYDIDERVKDMNAGGVLGSLNFPSFPGFAGRIFDQSDDKDLALVMTRAYNDWHIDEWCGKHPGRMIPLAIPVLWDPELLAGEIRRVAAKGCHAVTFPENPVPLGKPSLHDAHWDPFWTACCDTGTVVCMHIGSSSKLVVTSSDAPVDVMITLQPMNIVQAAADIVWSPVLRKFPSIKIALSEGGIGWIPYFLERIDSTYEKHRYWTGQDFGGLKPSDVFRRNVITCFIEDPAGIAARAATGVDIITWECDFPHSDSTWPRSPEVLSETLEGVSDTDIHKITHLNAMREFGFDPFTFRPRERCTVGALRAEAGDRDLTTN